MVPFDRDLGSVGLGSIDLIMDQKFLGFPAAQSRVSKNDLFNDRILDVILFLNDLYFTSQSWQFKHLNFLKNRFCFEISPRILRSIHSVQLGHLKVIDCVIATKKEVLHWLCGGKKQIRQELSDQSQVSPLVKPDLFGWGRRVLDLGL